MPKETIRSNSIVLTHNGESHNIAEWARIKGFNFQTLYSRYDNKWEDDRILSPVSKGKGGYKVPLEVRQQQLIQYEKEKAEILRALRPLRERRTEDYLSHEELTRFLQLDDSLEDIRGKIKNVKKRIGEWNITHSNRASGQCSHIAQQGV